MDFFLGYILDLVARIFSWRGFLVTTRLSYAIYLTQFPVFFYNIGVTKSSEEYNFWRMQVRYLPKLSLTKVKQ